MALVSRPPVPPVPPTADQHRQIDALASWLRDHVHGDVLVPVDPATKAPLVRHRDGAWSWARFEEFRASYPEHIAYGIAAQTLCVIDVDREAAIAPLLERFPCLARDAVRATTRKGAHFFFTRSPLCDRDGFYDARSPVVPGIDFKTRASTGTGGIIVVAPSAGKSWWPGKPPPWIALAGHAPPEIPEDLLRAVAKPSFPPTPVSFACADGHIVERPRSRHASRSAYVTICATRCHATRSEEHTV